MDSPTPSQANRRFWDADAERYHGAHGEYLSSFYWCPEMLHESNARLLGGDAELSRARVLELGCGSAPCTTWLQDRARLAVGMDISRGMLARAPQGTPLVQADALTLPFADAAFDVVFSAFGALPFLADAAAALADASRVLRPGGRLVVAAPHPIRWIFADDPDSFEVQTSYFDRAYLEHDPQGRLTYAEFHRTMGDWIRAFRAAGLELLDLIEPEWPADLATTWGQWSPARGEFFPGTAIFVCRRPAQRESCGA